MCPLYFLPGTATCHSPPRSGLLSSVRGCLGCNHYPGSSHQCNFSYKLKVHVNRPFWAKPIWKCVVGPENKIQ